MPLRPLSTTAAAVLSAGLLAVGALAMPAAVAGTTDDSAAETGSDTEPDGDSEDGGDGGLLRERADVACARVPNVVTRTENLQERLAGDASTRGSLAWLEARAEQAEERGRDEAATALRNRLEVRTELVDLLPLRLEALVDAEAACEEAGL
ncbi:MAG: hypothetical protein ACFCVG_17645 [Kineosporiaceae bacterium]